MYKIIKLRGSIFCPPIKYSKSFVAELVNELHDFTPMLIRDNSMISSIMQWQLISPDNNESLVFSNNKIDFIKNSVMRLEEIETAVWNNIHEETSLAELEASSGKTQKKLKSLNIKTKPNLEMGK